jgi:hypothetical protein
MNNQGAKTLQLQADKNILGHVFREESELNITFFFLGGLSDRQMEHKSESKSRTANWL